MIQVYGTLQVLGFKLTDAVRRRANGDKGQTAAEYMGIIVIVAIIIAAVAGSGIGATIASDITAKIAAIFGSA
jgi:hypothetical protein